MDMIKKIASFLLVVFLLVTLTVSVGAQELNLGFPEETTGESIEEPVLEDSENDLPEDDFTADDGEDISEEIQPEEKDDQDISLEEEPEEEEASAEPEEDGFDESEEDVFHDSEQEEFLSFGAAQAANSNIAVKKINSSYNLDEDYAFAYGYRKGKTTLTVQNGSASLLTRLDKQFEVLESCVPVTRLTLAISVIFMYCTSFSYVLLRLIGKHDRIRTAPYFRLIDNLPFSQIISPR